MWLPMRVDEMYRDAVHVELMGLDLLATLGLSSKFLVEEAVLATEVIPDAVGLGDILWVDFANEAVLCTMPYTLQKTEPSLDKVQIEMSYEGTSSPSSKQMAFDGIVDPRNFDIVKSDGYIYLYRLFSNKSQHYAAIVPQLSGGKRTGSTIFEKGRFPPGKWSIITGIKSRYEDGIKRFGPIPGELWIRASSGEECLVVDVKDDQVEYIYCPSNSTRKITLKSFWYKYVYIRQTTGTNIPYQLRAT